MAADAPKLRQLAAGFVATWRQLLGDSGVLLLLVAAPVLYAFFYPWPYADQAVTRVPVALVDLDGSSLSRQIARYAAASPRIELRRVTADEQSARRALLDGEIEGYAVLPRDLKRRVVRGEKAVVSIEANGAYALLNKAVLYGFAESVGTVSAGVEIRRLAPTMLAGMAVGLVATALAARVSDGAAGPASVGLFPDWFAARQPDWP